VKGNKIDPKISIISDEISQDFKTAVEIGSGWGIKNYEIRGINYKRVPDIDNFELSLIKDVIKIYKIKIVAISPGVFKIPWEEGKLEEHLKERLPKSFELARKLQTKLVIIFSPIKKEKEQVDFSQIIAIFKKAAKSAEKKGFILALENEPICYANTGKNTAYIVKEVGNPALKVNWDPANAFSSGEAPYPDGYRNIKDYIFHLHIKDVRRIKGEGIQYVPVGEGEINWKDQISALKRDKYQGYFSIETHFSPRIENTKKCLMNLRSLLGRI